MPIVRLEAHLLRLTAGTNRGTAATTGTQWSAPPWLCLRVNPPNGIYVFVCVLVFLSARCCRLFAGFSKRATKGILGSLPIWRQTSIALFTVPFGKRFPKGALVLTHTHKGSFTRPRQKEGICFF